MMKLESMNENEISEFIAHCQSQALCDQGVLLSFFNGTWRGAHLNAAYRELQKQLQLATEDLKKESYAGTKIQNPVCRDDIPF
jgi:hypothetical protein